MNPLNWFPGRKTYILAAAAIFTATGAFLSGDMAMGAYVEAMFGALGIATIRKGIESKS